MTPKECNTLRTYPVYKFVIFLLVVILGSVGMSIWFIFNNEPFFVKMIVWIMCGGFIFLSLIVIIDQLFSFIEVKGTTLIKHAFFFKRKYDFKSIDKIKNKDGFFTVFVKNVKVLTFASDRRGANEIMAYMDMHGVRIEW